MLHEEPRDAVADTFPIKSSRHLFQNWNLVGKQTSLFSETAWDAVHTPALCAAEPGAQIQFMNIVLQDVCSGGQMPLPGL